MRVKPGQKRKRALKAGSLSKDDRLYIEKYMHGMTDIEIGTALNRSPNQIGKYRRQIEYQKNNVDVDAALKEKYLNDFRDHPSYEKLKKQFTNEEFIGFETKYVGMLSQFQTVTFTEQEQIFDYITTSIYVDRIAEEQLQTLQQINYHTRQIDRLIGEGPNKFSENQTRIAELTQMVASLRSVSSAKTKEYNDLAKRKEDTLKQLKGTREQRIKKGEDAKINVIGLMRMLDDEDTRRELGVEMLLNEAAMEKEKKRLGTYHTYDDGEIDRPLLTSETVTYGEEASETPED